MSAASLPLGDRGANAAERARDAGASPVEPVPQRSTEQFDLVVGVAGELTLPPELLTSLQLTMGELISIETCPLSLRLGLYRNLLASDWEGLSLESAWQLVDRYLCQPLTAVLAAGRLPIPNDVLPLAVGDRLVLQIATSGLHHDLVLSRASTHVES